MLTLFDQLWARCLTPNEPVRSSLAGNLSPLLKTRTSPLSSTSRGALQKTAGNEVLPQDKKEEVEMSLGRLYPRPSLQRAHSRGDDARAAEFRRMMQNGRTVREFADRLVLLLRNQLRDPEHISRKTQGRNSIYLGSPESKGR
jgi:hypothetical protein